MRFRLLDLIWLTTVVGLVIALVHAHQTNLLQRTQLEQTVVQLERCMKRNTVLDNDLATAKFDLQQLQKSQYMFEAFSGKGVYLADSDRAKDAAASLEVAHKIQPENLCVVEKLIELYESVGLEKHAERHRRNKAKLAQAMFDRPVIMNVAPDFVWP